MIIFENIPHPSSPHSKSYIVLFFQDFAVTYWIEKGMPANKITLGVPLYGRCWTLKNGDDTGYYAPAPQPGAAGPYTRTPGFLGYNEVSSLTFPCSGYSFNFFLLPYSFTFVNLSFSLSWNFSLFLFIALSSTLSSPPSCLNPIHKDNNPGISNL